MPVVPIRPPDPEVEQVVEDLKAILPDTWETDRYAYLDARAFEADHALALGQIQHDTSARHLRWQSITDIDDPLTIDLDILDSETAVLHVTGYPEELIDVIQLLVQRVPRPPNESA